MEIRRIDDIKHNCPYNCAVVSIYHSKVKRLADLSDKGNGLMNADQMIQTYPDMKFAIIWQKVNSPSAWQLI